MDFGRVANIEQVDFTLPGDHPDTTKLLNNQTVNKDRQEVIVGCAKWGRKDWIGLLYPRGSQDVDFLGLYAKHFDSVELNASYHSIPQESWLKKWRSVVGRDFLFFPKVYKGISHEKRLRGADRLTMEFIDRLKLLENHLGTFFLQLHPSFSPAWAEVLGNYLQKWPQDIPLAVELRHEEWFTGGEKAEKIFALFRELGIGTVITDSSGRRDVIHQRLTNPEAFVRFVGNGLHKSDYSRIDSWVARINLWLNGGVEKIHFFMHQHDEKHSPHLCAYLIKKLNERCGLDLKVPGIIAPADTGQGSLF